MAHAIMVGKHILGIKSRIEGYKITQERGAMINRLAVAGPNSRFELADAQPAGFWAGFWHGIIAPIAFIVGLFQPGVRMYEVKNTGWHYDFGFLLGVLVMLGGGGSRTGVCSY